MSRTAHRLLSLVVSMSLVVLYSGFIDINTFTPIAKASVCNKWDLSKEFRVSPNQENPNRDLCNNEKVWHFLRSTQQDQEPQNYLLLAKFQENTTNAPSFFSWQGVNVVDIPNTNFPLVGIRRDNNIIVVHPDTDPESSIIGWKSPVSGNITVCGSFVDGDNGGGNGISWFIKKEGNTIVNGFFDNGDKQLFVDGIGGSSLKNLSINTGEFLYFVVNAKGDRRYDTTIVNLRIQLENNVCSPSIYLPLITR